MRYVTRTSALEYEDFNSAKSRLIERAEKFGEISYKATFSFFSTLSALHSNFPYFSNIYAQIHFYSAGPQSYRNVESGFYI